MTLYMYKKAIRKLTRREQIRVNIFEKLTNCLKCFDQDWKNDELKEKVAKPHFLVQFNGKKWIRVEEHGTISTKSHMMNRLQFKRLIYQITRSIRNHPEMFKLLRDSMRRRMELFQTKKNLLEKLKFDIVIITRQFWKIIIY